MRRQAVLLVTILSIAACRGDNNEGGGEDETDGGGGNVWEDPCGVCEQGGYAVDCGWLWGLGEYTVCGINQDNAEFLCESSWAGVVLASPSDNCDAPAPPWDPTPYIQPDPTGAADFIIDACLLDWLEERPQDIYRDGTLLDWDEHGEVIIVAEGELSSALGLATSDVLLDVNGYSFHDLLDTIGLYQDLRTAGLLTLRLVRKGEKMTISYSVVPCDGPTLQR